MENLKNIISFFDNHYQSISVLALLIGGIWGLLKFREQIKDKRFKTYHSLIDELVNEQRQEDRKIKLDRQIAIVYELRNFPKYFDVTERILIGLKDEWKDVNPRIITEISLTLNYIDRNYFVRIFHKK